MEQPRIIDCDYLLPEFAASYLLIEGDEAAFVETNTARAVPRLLSALEREGLRPEQVRWVIITHVHLDHAGGASALMAACPNATLLAHPRAARHMIDPSRLVASAQKVYGEQEFARMYGRIDPIPEARVRVMEDGEKLSWGSRTLAFFFTRGHANHHFCIHDSASDGVFTGDSFGLCYPALQSRGTFVFPSTSPTDFAPEEAMASVRRIAATGSRAYLTHFGEVADRARAADQLLEHLSFSEALMKEAMAREETGEALTAFCHGELRTRFQSALERHGLPTDEATWKLLKLDLDLNAQGIAYAAEKSRAKPA